MFRTTRTTQNNRQKFDFRKVGVWPQKSVFFISLLWVSFKKFNIMKQCITNLEQFRTTLRTGRTTWNNRQKFNFCERRLRKAKKAFFSSYNNGIQLTIWNNVQNNQNNLEQPAKVRFSKSGGLAQKFFFNSVLWVLFKKCNIMKQCITKLEQFGTTLRTGRTTWNNGQKLNFCERRVRQAEIAFFFRLTII